MDSKISEASEFSSPLLWTGNVESQGDGNDDVDHEGQRQRGNSSIPATLILSTLVAVLGSFVVGSAVAYSSPTQSRIMDDLNLGVAEAAGYYYHGLILDEGIAEKSHGMDVAALQAADEYFKEIKKLCEEFNAAPRLSRISIVYPLIYTLVTRLC